MDSDPKLPKFEIVVRWKASDIAVIAFFGDEGDLFDCVVGVEDVSAKQDIADVLYEAFMAVQNAQGWITLDRVSEGGDYPF